MRTARTLPAPPLPQTGTFNAPVAEEPKPGSRGTGSRAGKKCVPVWLPESAKRQLDFMAVEEDTTLQLILVEAVNLLFKKRGKPMIA